MNKTKSIIKIISIIFIILILNGSNVYASKINPSDFDPSKKMTNEDVSKVTEIANPIIGTIKIVGIVIAVIMMTVLGIKYMTGSVQEKAEYKKTMIPYLVGAIMIVAITQFVGLIATIVTSIK